jgi:hypothetical protein
VEVPFGLVESGDLPAQRFLLLGVVGGHDRLKGVQIGEQKRFGAHHPLFRGAESPLYFVPQQAVKRAFVPVGKEASPEKSEG